MAFPRPLAVGAAGGSVGTALLGILHQAFLHEVIPESVCICPDLPIDLDRKEIYIFLAGLGLGICLGPILDIFIVLRERWRRFICSRLFGLPSSIPQRPLHKVIS